MRHMKHSEAAPPLKTERRGLVATLWRGAWSSFLARIGGRRLSRLTLLRFGVGLLLGLFAEAFSSANSSSRFFHGRGPKIRSTSSVNITSRSSSSSASWWCLSAFSRRISFARSYC